jgi:hypothetical protein
MLAPLDSITDSAEKGKPVVSGFRQAQPPANSVAKEKNEGQRTPARGEKSRWS